MLPVDIINSEQPEVLRAALRLLDAQLSTATRLLKELADRIAVLEGVPVLQGSLDAINAGEVPPLPTIDTSPTPLEEAARGTLAPEPTPAPMRSKAKQWGHGPKSQPNLPVRELVCELEPADCACPDCGKLRKPLANQFETSEMIDVVEMKVELVTVRRAKYGCTCGSAIETAIGPARAIAGGRYSLAFAVHVAVQKYLWHMPLERQVRQFAALGLDVSSHVLWDQILALVRHVLPTVKAIQRAILKTPVIGVDQTGWRDLSSRDAKLKQLWGLSTRKLLYYQICPCKGLDSFRAVLGDYQGMIVCDEASTHTAAARRFALLFIAACWAHVLRRFREAKKSFPEAATPLRLIARLYEIEAAAESETDRMRRRRLESRPVIRELRTWLDARKAMPKATTLGSAIRYARNSWLHLTNFLGDSRIPLDNNQTERQLRGPVVGRKNYYGSKTEQGDLVATVFYTLFETAKLNDLPPQAYVEAIVTTATAYENAGAPVVLMPDDFKKQLADG